jgi:hypothetical protein
MSIKLSNENKFMSIKLSTDRLGYIGAKPGARPTCGNGNDNPVKQFANTDAVTFLNSQIPGSVDLVLKNDLMFKTKSGTIQYAWKTRDKELEKLRQGI